MMDPLSLLREYNINKKEIIERNSQIIFGELSWLKNVQTNCRIQISKKNNNNAKKKLNRSGEKQEEGIKEYYTLECLLYFLKNVQMIHPEYVKQAVADNIPAVKRPDRKQILAYLNGEITTCASIDNSVPLKKPEQVKRTHDDDFGESGSKKPCIEKTCAQ